MDRKSDMVGKRFGRLMVIKYSHSSQERRMWECLCDCGKITFVPTASLNRGVTESCGCLRNDRTVKAKLTHGMSKTPEYKAYQHMMSRCYNPNDSNYHNYGGRGIFVCEKWRGHPKAFLEDMGRKPSGCELERLDNNSGYSPSNCAWKNHIDQAKNRRTTTRFKYRGRMICLKDICKSKGLPYSTIHSRIKYGGWTLEDAISVPIIYGNNQFNVSRQMAIGLW